MGRYVLGKVAHVADDWTPVHIASWEGHLDALQYLRSDECMREMKWYRWREYATVLSSLKHAADENGQALAQVLDTVHDTRYHIAFFI